MNGFLCVLKPPGMTSSDVVVRVRHKLAKKEKVGHAGTLDPEACGVLPIMIGKATRLFDYIVEKEKVYIAELITGYSTDTQDIYGTRVAGEDQKATQQELEAVLPSFIGQIEQIPPMYSALKRDGKKLCDLARQGLTADVQARPIQIYGIRILHDLSEGRFILEIRCGRGTYIRTLCHDIGEALGCKACMGMLLRTGSGSFSLDETYTLEEIEGAEDLSSMLVPLDMPLGHLPRIDIKENAERFVRSGNMLELRELIDAVPAEGPLRLYLHDRFCGIGHFESKQIKFDAMLLE